MLKTNTFQGKDEPRSPLDYNGKGYRLQDHKSLKWYFLRIGVATSTVEKFKTDASAQQGIGSTCLCICESLHTGKPRGVKYVLGYAPNPQTPLELHAVYAVEWDYNEGKLSNQEKGKYVKSDGLI